MMFGFLLQVSRKSARTITRGLTLYFTPAPYCKPNWKIPPPSKGGVLPKSNAALITPMFFSPSVNGPAGFVSGDPFKAMSCNTGPTAAYGLHREVGLVG